MLGPSTSGADAETAMPPRSALPRACFARSAALSAAALSTFTIACATPARAAEMVQIPSRNGTMVAEVFKPSTPPPYPVVVFSHGRSGDPAVRAALSHPMPAHHVAFWTARGVAVVAPIRPGYGATGGPDVEANGVSHCNGVPNYARTAGNAALAIEATVAWVRQQPWARPKAILLEGQSVGGLGTVAAAARHPPGVVAYVNFAGGSGGDPERTHGASCRPDLLTALYGRSTSSLPGLWFYAANDEYWGAEAPRAWASAYRAGGGRAQFVFTAPTPNGKGHSLLRSAPSLYEGALAEFAGRHGF
jgi:dienelactone hydrolase